MTEKFAGYSRAFQGAIIVIILLAKSLFDVELTEADLEPIVTGIVTLVAAIYSLYGTINRNSTLTLNPLKKKDNTITYGTIEDYSNMDFVMGADANKDKLPVPVGFNPEIQYNQNEYKDGSYYCTAYACFIAYSFFTGKPFTLRKKFIDVCLEEGLIVDGVGGYLHEVFHRFIKFCKVELGEHYDWFRVEMGSSIANEVRRLGYALVTGYRGGKEFNSDRQNDCIVQMPKETTTTYGHALGDFWRFNDMRQDNYEGRDCNIYQVEDYQDWVTTSKYHFRYGYFLTKVDDDMRNDYIKRRNEIILPAIEKLREGKDLSNTEIIALRNWGYGNLLLK